MPIELAACERGQWCWVHGARITAVHGAADGTVFAVGASGTLLEWTEDGWFRHDGVISANLVDVWVAAADDIWIAAADGTVSRFDGEALKAVPVRGTHLTGTAPDDVWIDTQHFDGETFSAADPSLGIVFDVLAGARGEAWALALKQDAHGMVALDGAVVLHFDGSRWARAGESLGTVFFGGGSLLRERGEIWVFNALQAFRFDGQSWVEVPDALSAQQWSVPSVQAAADEIILHDGERFTTVPASTRCLQAIATKGGETFCIGPEGRLFHLEGDDWVRTPFDAFDATLGPQDWGRVPPALWASSARMAWGAGPSDVIRVRPDESSIEPVWQPPGVLERYDGKAWTELTRGVFHDLDGAAADDVWIAGEQLLHFDGRALEAQALPEELGTLEPIAVHVLRSDSVWLIARREADGAQLLLHYDGRWSVELMRFERDMADPVAFVDIAGTSERDLWLLVTRQPISKSATSGLLHFDGASWQPIEFAQYAMHRAIETDGERLWLHGVLGVQELVIDALPALEPGQFLPPVALTASGELPIGGKLWLGETDLWVTSAEQAMRMPL